MKFFTKVRAIISPRGEHVVDDVLKMLEESKVTDVRVENGIIYATVAMPDVRELRRIANVFTESLKTV